MNLARFVEGGRRHLRHPRTGDVVIIDILSAHEPRQVRELIETSGASSARCRLNSPDFNRIESRWALWNKGPRAVAPRMALALRRTARRVRPCCQTASL